MFFHLENGRHLGCFPALSLPALMIISLMIQLCRVLLLSSLLNIEMSSTCGRMDQLMKLMSACQGLRKKTLTAWFKNKKQHHSLCLRPQPRSVSILFCKEPTVVHRHLHAVHKPTAGVGPASASVSTLTGCS